MFAGIACSSISGGLLWSQHRLFQSRVRSASNSVRMDMCLMSTPAALSNLVRRLNSERGRAAGLETGRQGPASTSRRTLFGGASSPSSPVRRCAPARLRLFARPCHTCACACVSGPFSRCPLSLPTILDSILAYVSSCARSSATRGARRPVREARSKRERHRRAPPAGCWRECGAGRAPHTRAGRQRRRHRAQQCTWRAWSTRGRGGSARGGREPARRRLCERPSSRICWGREISRLLGRRRLQGGSRRAGAGVMMPPGHAEAGWWVEGGPGGPWWSPARVTVRMCES